MITLFLQRTHASKCVDCAIANTRVRCKNANVGHNDVIQTDAEHGGQNDQIIQCRHSLAAEPLVIFSRFMYNKQKTSEI